MEAREMKLLATKGGSGSSTFRVTLPTTWVREMGLNEDVRDLNLHFNSKEIIIKNKKELETMKLELKLLVDEGMINLTLKGKLISFKERKYQGEEIRERGEHTTIIGRNDITERDEKWEIIKKDGSTFEYEIKRRSTTYKKEVKEEIFEDYFSDKIVYEDWGIEELKEFGEVEVVKEKLIK